MITTENFIEVVFKNVSEIQNSVLIALLSECGFDGFEEENNVLKCYVLEKNFDVAVLDEIANDQDIIYTINIIQPQNWNAVWEENFEPVQVEDFVHIRAAFHPANSSVQHEIIITPKMSFGTGHHATTYMMIEQMRKLDFKNKQVLDFGTGTGILAILAEKSGAKNIDAIDNDEWSIVNAIENIAMNNCTKINLYKNDKASLHKKFDIVLANINKNIILDNFNQLYSQATDGGYVIVSGLLAADEKDIFAAAKSFSAVHLNTLQREQWISMLYQR